MLKSVLTLSVCAKRRLRMQGAQYNLYIDGGLGLRPRSNCQISKLPEDVNYIKSALTDFLQHGRGSGAEHLLIKRNISIANNR